MAASMAASPLRGGCQESDPGLLTGQRRVSKYRLPLDGRSKSWYGHGVGQMSAPLLASPSASPSCAPPPSAARARHLTPFPFDLTDYLPDATPPPWMAWFHGSPSRSRLTGKAPVCSGDVRGSSPRAGSLLMHSDSVGGARYRGPSWRTPDNRPGAPKMMKAPAPPLRSCP